MIIINNRVGILLILMLISATILNAQVYKNDAAKAIHPDARKLYIDQITGSVQYIEFSDPISIEKSEEIVRRALKLDEEISLQREHVSAEREGIRHRRYNLAYKSVLLENQQLKLHEKDGQIISLNTNYIDGAFENSPDQVIIDSTEAYDQALEYFNLQLSDIMPSDSTRLVYFYHENKYRLVWQCDVYSLQSHIRQFVYVDAIDGTIIDVENRLHHTEAPCFAYTRYSGIRPMVADSTEAGYQLHDYTRGEGIVTKRLGPTNTLYNASNIINQDTVWNNFYFSETGSLDAHWGAEKCYDYFFEKYQRNSFDGLGGLIKLYVNYSFIPDNAFWTGSELVFGNGGEDANPYTSIDIVGHEYTHALTEHTADLNYTGESGALNESFSDIFGVVIEHYTRSDGSANFLLGDEVKAIPHRNMANPNEFEHPDTYLGNHWDYGADGIHTNSGVQNYWFYLLCEGGSGVNDLSNYYFVEPIGMESAAIIAYETLSSYLSPNDNYSQARFYSLQAAIDLFGECSAEAVAVAASWHAVGIGEPIEAVRSDFQVSQNYSCSVPTEVELTNLSENSDSFMWEFGNGSNSSLATTTVTYNEPGTYSITLIANGNTACNSTDSKSIIVQIESDGPLLPTLCVSNANGMPETGIVEVEIGDISNISGDPFTGHENFSCNHFTELVLASNHPFRIEMYSTAFLYILLDLNNDLEFSENEVLYSSSSHQTVHENLIFIPTGSVMNTSLRLRVISSQEAISDVCNEVLTDQIEDYRARIIENTLPPVANFEASSQYVIPGAQVVFTDLSLNLPTSWEWQFPGGIPLSSAEQNPIIIYQNAGNYNVQLICSNAYGSDTLFIPYGIVAQDVLQMCYATESSSPVGTITDSGGITGSFLPNEECGFLIHPPCAQEITLSFISYDMTMTGYLRIYDGPDENSPLLIEIFEGGTPPDITAYSGQMYLKFNSDYFTSPGFVANWTTIFPTQSPTANMLVSDINPPVSIEITFSDNSTDLPSEYFWDFGDGTTSTEKNNEHTYDVPGTYEVVLEVANCYGQDVTNTIVEVQPYPEIGFNPTDTIFFEIGCDQQMDTAIYVFNNGLGDLVFFDGISHLKTDSIEIAILGTHASSNSIFHLNNALNNLLDIPFKSEVITSFTPGELSQDLIGKDVLIIAQQNALLWNLPNSSFADLYDVINDFVRSGKTLIWPANEFVHTKDFWDVEWPMTFVGNTIFKYIPGHPIAQGINTFPSENDFPYRIIGDDITSLFGPNNDYDGVVRATVFYRTEKYGKLIKIGHGFNVWNFNYAAILKNSIKYGAYDPYVSWIESMDIDSGAVAPNASLALPFTFSSADLDPGIYYDNLTLYSNDPENDTITYVIALVVREDPKLILAQDTLFFDPIMVGTSASQTITLDNVACGPDTMSLHIASSDISFYAEVDQIFIASSDAGSVAVFFDSDVLGMNNAYLVLDYGISVDTLFLQGFTTPPPVQVISTDTIVVELNACQKYYTVNFDVINVGDAELHFDITGSDLAYYPLATLKSKLDEGHHKLTNEIIRLFLFEGGDSGYMIPYHDWSPYSDYGNILKTNFKDSIPYTNGEVISADYFGENGSYFTAKYPGLFFMAADLNGVDSYEINGLLGFNQYTTNDEIYSYELNYTNGFSEYSGFVYNTLSANSSSLTHLIITDANENVSFYTDPNTEVEGIRIEGLQDNKRIYQFTVSTAVINTFWLTSTFSDTPSRGEMEHVFHTFIDWMEGPEENLQITESVVAPQSIRNVQFDLNTYKDSTELFIPIYISGNDPYNATDTLIVHLTIAAHSCADFEFEVENYCTGNVQFISTSSKPADSYSWDFGDGNGSELESPEHNFPATGIYTVTLEVCTDGVCNVVEKELDILLYEELTLLSCQSHIQYALPFYYVAVLKLGDQSHSSNLPTVSVNEDNRCKTQFIAQLGEPINFEIIRNYTNLTPDILIWIDFNNDGLFQDPELVYYELNVSNTHSQGIITIPDFAQTDEPLIFRTVVGIFPINHDICEQMYGGHNEDHTLIIEGFPNAPQPIVSYTELDSCPGVYQFNFELLSSIDSCQWIFGDGTTSNDLSPVHSYEEDGTYNVFLVVYNTDGIGSDELVINEISSGIFGVTNGMNTTAGTPFAFVAQNYGVSSFYWDFGDGNTAQTQIASVVHTYGAAGLYTVTVSTNEDVCFNAFTRQILISPDVNVLVNSLESERFHVFPNPTDDQLYLRTDFGIIDLILIDTQGRQLNVDWRKIDEDQYEISLANLTPAMYNLLILTKDQYYMKRIIVQK